MFSFSYIKQIDAYDETNTSSAISVIEITADFLSPELQSHPSNERDIIGAWIDFTTRIDRGANGE